MAASMWWTRERINRLGVIVGCCGFTFAARDVVDMPAPGEMRPARFTAVVRDRIWELIYVTVRLVRNLAIYELIIGGDCWDRGPRGDRVVDYLRQQPNVSFIW